MFVSHLASSPQETTREENTLHPELGSEFDEFAEPPGGLLGQVKTAALRRASGPI